MSFAAPSAIQTSLALRHSIWRKPEPNWHVCGIPQVLYTDHGSDFTSRHLEHETADLKIQLIFSGVARPRGRGKIERFFRSVNQVFLSQFPGYAQSQSERKAVLILPQLAAELERYLCQEYHVNPHRAAREASQARWAAGGFLPHMPESLEQLDLLLLTVPKTRRIRQDGIRFMGLRYIDPTLAAFKQAILNCPNLLALEITHPDNITGSPTPTKARTERIAPPYGVRRLTTTRRSLLRK